MLDTLSSTSQSNDPRRYQHDTDHPVLIVVMGVSGSGKSTLGLGLAQDLGIPFVDGDDLHPASSVAKMSRGEPLDDSDREPWLKAIRAKAIELTSRRNITHSNGVRSQIQNGIDKHNGEALLDASNGLNSDVKGHKEAKNVDTVKFHDANTLETPVQSEPPRLTPNDNYHPQALLSTLSDEISHAPAPRPRRRACIIACSALKQTYRQLLRGRVEVLDTNRNKRLSQEQYTSNKSAPETLEVFHLYPRISSDELLERMKARQGHFMKENMLRSQLATFEEPCPGQEENVLIVEGGTPQAMLERAKIEVEKAIGPVY